VQDHWLQGRGIRTSRFRLGAKASSVWAWSQVFNQMAVGWREVMRKVGSGGVAVAVEGVASVLGMAFSGGQRGVVVERKAFSE